MSNISSEQIEKELKAATGDELRRNREVRSNYWRDLSLTAKLGPFPIGSFFFIVILMFYPTYTSLFMVIVFFIVYAIANSRGLSFRQLFYYIQSMLRGRKMSRKITLFGYEIR